MKTITVRTTEQKVNPVIRYAINTQYGIQVATKKEINEACTEKRYNENYIPTDNKTIRLRIYIADMYPGTHSEWDNHIYNCVVDKLTYLGLIRTGNYFPYIV